MPKVYWPTCPFRLAHFFDHINIPATSIRIPDGSCCSPFGEHKVPIGREVVEEPPCSHVSASAPQQHANARFVLDWAAAAPLTWFESPWLAGPPKHIHFLGLPFSEPSRVRKKPIGPEEIAIAVTLLEQVKPHHIYATGDLTEDRPHETARVYDRLWLPEDEAIEGFVLYRGGETG